MTAPAPEGLRSIAFYLPQYHPIPENDEWWGEGFTEWTNVTKARPLFPGHHQPDLPGELGFYDLRDARVREAQADLARKWGIDAFCYYHYWFGGRRLLERPFDEVLAAGRPDFPFCLCWANEPWTRVWDGADRHVLVEQSYSEDDDRRHIDWLIRAFRDERYVRVEGKPLFLVYRAGALPDPVRTTALWREAASRRGFPGLFLCRVENRDERGDPTRLGFDAAVEFHPNAQDIGSPPLRLLPGRLLRRLGVLRSPAPPRVVPYEALVRQARRGRDPGYLRFPGVTPQWDNTPRRPERAFVLQGSTPELFGRWVEAAVRRLEPLPPERRLLFVNAWNEWAEGCHLEPCQRWGTDYLEAFAVSVGKASSRHGRR